VGLKPPERRKERVPLYSNEDQDQLTKLLDAMEAASVEVGPQRLTDAPVQEAAAAYDEFLAEATERADHVAITALPKTQWRDLLAAYPPREPRMSEDGETVLERFVSDEQHGFNTDELAQPLVLASLDVDQFDSPEDIEPWVDELDDQSFSRIYSAAVRINEGRGPNPNFSASSWLVQTSAAMSRSAERSVEASARSTDSPTRIADSSVQSG
jgi:hypothetical protein